MSPGHLFLVVRAEVSRVFQHPAGRLGLVLAGLCGLAGPLLIFWLGTSGAEFNGRPVEETLPWNAPGGILWSLNLRNLSHMMRIALIAVVAVFVAGEIRQRTLREALLRPVPRYVVPLAKWSAMACWVLAANLLTWCSATLVGALLLGTDGNWSRAASVLGHTMLGDLGMAATALALAILTRSVAGTMVATFMLVLANWSSRGMLFIIEEIARQAEQPSIEGAIQVLRPFAPSYALDSWTGASFAMLSLGDDAIKPMITLFLWTVGCLALAAWRLGQLDLD